MKERIKALTELLNGFSEAIGADGMVSIMEALTEMNGEADVSPDAAIAEELANLKAAHEQLTTDYEAEKAARAEEKGNYAKKLAALITGAVEDEEDTVEDVTDETVDEEVKEEELYGLLFD